MGDIRYDRVDPEIDAVAAVLMDAWEAAEHTPVSVSYVATFADMARAVVARQKALDAVNRKC